MSKGVLTVVSGFSGAGKGTVMKRLIQKYDDYALSISVTTRNPREGERDGIEYFFKTKEEVEAMIENDEFLEYARYVDNYYGTPRFYVEEMLAKGKNVILEIEIQGAMQIKAKNPEAVLVFVTPPSFEELRNRLVGRGTETADVIESRTGAGYVVGGSSRQLRCRYFSVYRQDPCRKKICSAVIQKSHSFYSFFVLFTYC